MNWMTSMCKCVCVRGREGGRIVTHQCHDFFVACWRSLTEKWSTQIRECGRLQHVSTKLSKRVEVSFIMMGTLPLCS